MKNERMEDKTTITVEKTTSNKIAGLLPLAKEVTGFRISKSGFVDLAVAEYEKVLRRKANK